MVTVTTVFPKNNWDGAGDTIDNLSAVGVDITTIDNAVQLMNALPPIVVTEFGIAIVVNSLQKRNAFVPIIATDEPNTTDVNAEQASNALSPIVVTEFGIVMGNLEFDDFKAPANANAPIVSSKLSLFITRDDNLSQNRNALAPIVLTEFGIAIDVNEEQAWKAALPMPVTEEPNTTDDNTGHSLNAPSLILVTEFGIVTLANL